MASLSSTLSWPFRAADLGLDILGGRGLRCIWAVARQTLAEAVRMKIAVFFMVLMVVGFWAATRTVGDGTVSGRVQSFLAYSLTAVGFLLALLSIFLSRSLSDELVNRQILMLMTKPIPRWQFLLGKWLGVVLLDAMLLTLTGAGIYLTVTRYLAKQPPLNELDRTRLFKEVLTARHASPFAVPDFTAEVNRLYARNLEEGKYEEQDNFDPKAEKTRLYKYLETRWRVVPMGEYRDFEFANVLCERSAVSRIQIRYKAKANRYPDDEVVASFWMVGDPDKDAARYQTPRRDVGNRFQTISIPADAVAADGTLRARFWNLDPFAGELQFDKMFIFEGDRAVEVLFVVGSFGGNLVRMLLLMQCKLMFLSAVALMFATVLSFPVACLCAMTVYILAATRRFVGEALEMLDREGAVGVFREGFNWVLKGLYLLVPDFARYSATELVADGRNVTLAWVLSGVLYLVVIGAGLFLLIAWVLFYRREVSEVSV